MSDPRKVPEWVCDLGDGTFDHDWEYVSDWAGDPSVPNGTYDCSFKRCRQCGEEAPLDVGETPSSFDEDYT